MGLKFAANLNFLFTEGAPSVLEKIRRAKQAGFHAVEISYPNCEHINSIAEVKEDLGIEVALINIALDGNEYAFGSACIPGAEQLFKKQLDESISLANKLNCKKFDLTEQIEKAEKNSRKLWNVINTALKNKE